MATKDETRNELQDHLMALRMSYAGIELDIAKLKAKLKENLVSQCEIHNRMVMLERKGE